MKQSKPWNALLASCGFLVLIFDSKTAVSSAVSGMELCLKTVIPSLFPFFVLSALLTSSLSGTQWKILSAIGKAFRISPGAESVLLPAFLGGYPAGAQNISLACSNGSLSESDARRILPYCNNAGPAFLFGMLTPLFPDIRMVWLLWLIQIAGALFTAHFSGEWNGSKHFSAMQTSPAPDIMLSSLKAMGVVCGWILLFRILLSFLSRWVLWMFPVEIQVLTAGILELSNGCLMLSRISDPSLRFVMAAVFLSFGGLCVTMQTGTVSGVLFGATYLKGKLLQTIVSLLLAAACAYPLWAFPCFLLLFFLFLLGKNRKSSSIPETIAV